MVGCVVGSFLGLVIDRVPRQESIIFGRSHCDQCGHPLRPRDLIPLFSQLFSKNRCRYCKAKLSWFYFYMEVATGLLFILPALHFFSLTQTLSLLCCLVLSIFDLRAHEFPLSVWCFFAIFLFCMTPFSATDFIWLLLALLAEKRNLKIGSGDFLWLFIAALTLDFIQLVWAIQIASFLGIFWYLLLHKRLKKKNKSLEIAFIPFLSIGYLVVLLLGQIH